MPIKPENRDRYPAEWDLIRSEILDRAGGRCEFCDLKNGQPYYLDAAGGRWRRLPPGVLPAGDLPAAMRELVIVVLTVHHLDATPENCAPTNLVALCQRCHLADDRRLREAARHRDQMAMDL